MHQRDIVTAKTSGLIYLSEAAPADIAVLSLVMSVGCDLDFNGFHLGLLASAQFNWASNEFENLSEAQRARLLQNILRTDSLRRYALDALNQHNDQFAEDIAPLGRALSLIWREGTSKKDALEEQSRFGAFLRRHDDPDNVKAWPKSLLDISVRSLERKWSKYQRVFPYVVYLYLNQRAAKSGSERLSIGDIQPLSESLRERLVTGARTRKPDLPPWIELRFL